jgi:hypothetical protein
MEAGIDLLNPSRSILKPSNARLGFMADITDTTEKEKLFAVINRALKERRYYKASVFKVELAQLEDLVAQYEVYAGIDLIKLFADGHLYLFQRDITPGELREIGVDAKFIEACNDQIARLEDLLEKYPESENQKKPFVLIGVAQVKERLAKAKAELQRLQGE